MKRIAITIPEKDLQKLDDYVEKLAFGSLERNRSACVVDLIRRYIPSTHKISA